MEEISKISIVENAPGVIVSANSKENSFSCIKPFVSFPSESTLKKRFRKQSNGKPHTCNLCEKSFARKDSLSLHMTVHSNEKPFLCSECGQGFSRKGNLTAHMRVHTNEKPFLCKLCDKSFKHRCNLREHTKFHLDKRPYSCPLCGRGFTQSSDVTTHMRVHTKEKPFKCMECDKGFARKCTLRNHMRTHTLERPYLCTECGKSFSVKSALTIHMRIHTQERPYSCSVCGKSFRLKNTLTTHMIVHTDERPYSCVVCMAKFTRSAHLNRHMKRHTEGRTIGAQKNMDLLNITSPGSDESPVNSAIHDKFSKINESSNPYNFKLVERDETNMVCVDSFKPDPEISSDIISSKQLKDIAGLCVQKMEVALRSRVLYHPCESTYKEKPFKCMECGKGFAGKCTLCNHMRTHLKNNILVLNLGSFIVMSTQAVHMRSHTQERSYSCSVCGKSFCLKKTHDHAHRRDLTHVFYAWQNLLRLATCTSVIYFCRYGKRFFISE
ncbi:hypothetical protein SK128_019745 [Halocaridina rubra]|uniref:C2H2-type domain-containing protein n=1 Tax=Halocaridina rubra TaxID=373956 RepID=A0AAN8XA21_HALRR